MEHLKEAFLVGEKVYLRAFKEGDEIVIARLENHPDPRDTLFFAFPVPSFDVKNRILNQIKDKSNIFFTICEITTGNPIGQTGLVRIDWVGRMGTFYIGIADKENWSKGYGSESVKLMLKYSFDIINLHRVQLHVAVKNEKGVKAYLKNGFKIEGELREAMYQNGEYFNFYIMGILEKEYRELFK